MLNQHLTKNLDKSVLWVFLIPITIFIEISFIGRIFLAEIILISICIKEILGNKRLKEKKQVSIVLVLALIWLLSQIITDIYMSTPFVDWVRGWAKITFFIIEFYVLSLIFGGSSRKILFFLLGLSSGGIIAYLINPSEYSTLDPWKFGYGFWLTIILSILPFIFLKRNKIIISIFILLILGILNLFNGYRSLGGLCLLSFIICLISYYKIFKKLNKVGIFIIIPLALFASFGVYKSLEEGGALGEASQMKYESQSSGDYGLLIGGRSEILVASLAIYNSPFLGYGSWAKDPYYSSLYKIVKADSGYAVDGQESESDLIPTHSYLFGAWVESGIAGAIFWLYCFYLTTKAIILMLLQPSLLIPSYVLFFSLMLWSILFSPFGAETRLIAAVFMCASISMLNGSSKNKIES